MKIGRKICKSNDLSLISTFFSHVILVVIVALACSMFTGCSDDDNVDNGNDDPGEAMLWYADADGDGYGDPENSMQAQDQPSGYVADNADCNDNDAGIHPDATEICGDGIDNDCSGMDDPCPGETTSWYKDADGDGYSDGTVLESIEQPDGYFADAELKAANGDCNDSDASIYPNAVDVCGDDIDQDCSGADAVCPNNTPSYPVVGTRQTIFYNNTSIISEPGAGEDFYGQDAHYPGNAPSYTDNGDGTVTDNITGLMWSQTADLNGDGVIDSDDKRTYIEALAGASSFNLAGYTDWRLPSIKEAYSLILFSGEDISGYTGTTADGIAPFIDMDYFGFGYGDVDAGERLLEGQMASSTKYVTTTRGEETMFGVNFVDGRIKGYGLETSFTGGPKVFYVMYVRGNEDYGKNVIQDNGDGTITDNATGLMWMQNDSGQGMNWKDALKYAENSEFAGYTDWRLPDAKELQSLIDYTRSPETSNSAAIDPLFNCTQITNENGEADYPYYWTGTTHASWKEDISGKSAVYLSFGRAMGFIDNEWTDVHGAGAQRSDPKTGDPNDYPNGFGPQGDAIRINNYVRLVR